MRAVACKDLQLFPDNSHHSGGGSRNCSLSNNSNSSTSYNIHVDSRVVRGNTFASTVLTSNQRRNKKVKEREDRRRRQAINRKASCTGVSFLSSHSRTTEVLMCNTEV